MDFDNEFYQQWKAKSTNSHCLFTDNSESSKINKKLIETDKIFSSTTLEDQTDIETFSLHLSESYIDETQESLNLKTKRKTLNEVIMISDSSDDESIILHKKSYEVKNNKHTQSQVRKGVYVLESSDDKCCQIPVQQSAVTNLKRVNSMQRVSVKQTIEKNVILEESDSEIDPSQVPKIIKETVAESIALSDRKKKEILNWLSTNFDGSRCGSSCSQESAISNSRKSTLSSGNSSLERLELNFETPNNRGKLSKPSSIQKSNKKIQDSENQTTIDQYFTKTKKSQLDIVKDRTPRSKNSDKTPVNSVKAKPRRIIIPESESYNSNTPESKKSDRTPMNSVTNNPRRIIIPESQSFESNDRTNIFERLDSENSEDKISASKSLPKKTSVIIPESISSQTNEDLNLSISSLDSNVRNKENLQKHQAVENTTINSTVNDCADILENLYGVTWRNQAKTLICNTEPKKQATKIIFPDPQSEHKITFRKGRLEYESDDDTSDKENDLKIQPKRSQTTSKKSKNRNRPKHSFINDESTTESSPDCSYYTALTNPIPSQNNQFKTKTASTIKVSDKTSEKPILSICDSESDLDNRNWPNKDTNRKKLSFASSSSSITSEFDPEDVVPPKAVTKTVTKTVNAKKVVNFKTTKSKVIDQPEKENTKKSFIASLSKDVPLENADFKAMAYRVKYNTMKEELCKYLYKLFNEKVFDNQLPADMSIEWSVRLRGTAGKCYNKQSLKALGKTVRSSRIVLATKILDSADRLRDTLIHEMCHAATWLINNISDGHGSFWKAWAHKATKAFPELPPISRCHNYEIQTKYTYKCTTCGYSVGRHSKSLDLNRKRCGYCHGTFELLINKVTKAGKVQTKSTPAKEPSGFALYVKENYHLVKQSGAAVKHGEVMKLLGQKFSSVKISRKTEDRITKNIDESP